MSNRYWLAIGVFFLTACGRTTLPVSPGDRPQPTLDPQIETGRERITPVAGITINPDNERRHFLSTSTTTLQMLNGIDSGEVIVKMTLGFSASYSRIHPLRTRITGALTRISVRTEGLSEGFDEQLTLPLEFTGHIESGGLYLESLAGSPVSTVVNCQAVGLNGITALQRSLVVPPLTLSTGTTWTDSSTVPACSGSVQLALTAVRTYTVAGQTMRDAQPVIAVDRHDRVRATGEGAQGQHRVSILSQGSGSARIYLDPTTGVLREAESTQTTDLVIGSSGRSQRFQQMVEERVRLQQ